MPPSEVPLLECPSKTQPFPLKPPLLARMSFAAADVATVTPELEAACKKLMEGVQSEYPLCTSACGCSFLATTAASWAGTAFNPQLGYLFVTRTSSASSRASPIS